MILLTLFRSKGIEKLGLYREKREYYNIDKITSTFHTINIFDSIQVESEKFLFFVIIWFICFFVDIERFSRLNFLHNLW